MPGFRPVEERFWEKVDKTPGLGPKGECWEWTGSKDTDGYGLLRVKGKLAKAHRFSYELHYRPISKGALICHDCDNPPCVRPDHFFEGTYLDNMADRNAKGRQAKGDRVGSVTHPESRPRGERVFTAKLTADDVREIRQRWANAPVKWGLKSQLAREYGVGSSIICRIIKGDFWKHIEED